MKKQMRQPAFYKKDQRYFDTNVYETFDGKWLVRMLSVMSDEPFWTAIRLDKLYNSADDYFEEFNPPHFKSLHAALEYVRQHYDSV